MNPHCSQQAMVCHGLKCGFPSARNPQIVICRMCRAAEKAEDNRAAFNTGGQGAGLEHTASVSFNPQDGRFIFDQSFFEIVQMEDQARQEFHARTAVAERAISLSFSRESREVEPPVEQIVDPMVHIQQDAMNQGEFNLVNFV